MGQHFHFHIGLWPGSTGLNPTPHTVFWTTSLNYMLFSLTYIDDIVPIHFIQIPLKPFLWTNPPRTPPCCFLAVWQISVIMVGPLSSGISITWWGEWEVISSPKRPTTKVTSSPKSRKSPEKLSTCGEAGPLGGCWSLLGVVSQQLVAELWLANTSEFISLHMKFSYMEVEAWYI